MKETKDELRIKIKQLESQNRKLELENASLTVNFKKDLENQKQAFEILQKEQAYMNFVNQNGEFLQRYVREIISNNLEVILICGYNETITAKFKYEDEIISSSEDYIKHDDNPNVWV